VHASISHLVGNVVMQLLIGIGLERVHGSLRVALLYTLSGVAGAANVVMFVPHSTVVGASGAIYGLMGVTLANVVVNWDVMPNRWWRLLFSAVLVAQDAVLYFVA
jgi:rhomboid-related protein 1/2/3